MYNLEPHNSRIRLLKSEIEEKNEEIYKYMDRIELLEDNIMELEYILSNHVGDPLYQRIIDIKVNVLLKEKELKIKELKHSLSFLRKEMIILKRTYENGNNVDIKKPIILKETIPPLESLVQELQYKISKNNLRLEHYNEEKRELTNLLNVKKNLIDTLHSEKEILTSDLEEKNKEINKLKNTITQLELMFLETRKNS
ncbi:MAG: hypothetical protein KGD63_06510 [Candidatus Lokiarchaeota archaeon]|nr:hypothetical protein [Candidatus Lokiarchaeota archaeon]